MTRPERGDGDAERFDEIWGELVDSAPDKRKPGGATQIWTEEVRGERKQEPAPPEPGEPQDAPSAATKAWTEEVRGERKRSPSPSSSSSALLGPDPEWLHASAKDEMERLMSAPRVDKVGATSAEAADSGEWSRERATPSEPVESAEAETGEARAENAEAAEAVADEALEDEGPPWVPPDERPLNRAGLWIAGLAAVVVVGYLVVGGDPSPATSTSPPAAPTQESPTKAGALADAIAHPEGEPDPAPSEPPEHPEHLDPDPDPDPGKAPPGSDAARQGPAREIVREGDPRAVPEGTTPENAAAFRKLPVAPSDSAPVGGVGVGGVHVDRISMGATYERSRCEGKTGQFSVSAKEQVNVCFRAVHQRQKEELVVLWQKDGGGTARRGKVVVKAAHAYRTRAYLVLRREYLGPWTVRILDPEGTELASYPFTVVE